MAVWNDKEMVLAVLRHDAVALEHFYREGKNYFLHHAAAVFVGEADIDDIFQEALVHLWREIETHRIELSDDRICRWVEGRREPMSSSLLTFLMAIAKRKHWELVRKQKALLLTDSNRTLEVLDCNRYVDAVEELTEQEQRERVVADAVLAMTERCRQILTMFYYEHRTLDEILSLRKENISKMGLKTSKYKCMQRLRALLHERFRELHIEFK